MSHCCRPAQGAGASSARRGKHGLPGRGLWLAAYPISDSAYLGQPFSCKAGEGGPCIWYCRCSCSAAACLDSRARPPHAPPGTLFRSRQGAAAQQLAATYPHWTASSLPRSFQGPWEARRAVAGDQRLVLHAGRAEPWPPPLPARSRHVSLPLELFWAPPHLRRTTCLQVLSACRHCRLLHAFLSWA